MTSKDLVIPTEIPWDKLKGKELEELLYWLLDSMGAKDLEWRIGGKGSGTSDQGRDLECSFYMSAPDGDLTKQRWWVEAKGRSSTVEPSDVKESILNATGKQDVDVLLVVTNSNFSNPTRDWVKNFQKDHPRPIIKLWEQSELERLCSKFPMVIIRLFSKALSPQGQLEVVRSRLWNYATFTDDSTLKKLWTTRKDLDILSDSLLSLVISESANGDLARRSWGMFVSEGILLSALMTFLGNFLYLMVRSEEKGNKQSPYMNSGAYLILCCINRIGSSVVSSMLEDWSTFDNRDWPDEVRSKILSPVLDVLVNDLRDVCTNDCSRVLTDPMNLSNVDIAKYFDRLKVMDQEPVKSKEESAVLAIESYDEPCKVGFCLNKDNHCPINNNNNPEIRISATLAEVEKILKFRTAKA